MAKYSYTDENGITFSNLDSNPAAKKTIPGKLVYPDNEFEYATEDGIKPVVNAVEIDWNGANLAYAYASESWFEDFENVQTTGQIIQAISTAYHHYPELGDETTLTEGIDTNPKLWSAKDLNSLKGSVIEKATTDKLGTIKINGVKNPTNIITANETNRYYGVEINNNGKAFVNVPWISYTLPKATTGILGGILSSNTLTTAVTLTSANGTTADRYYGVQTDKDGKAFVNIPWTEYTLPQATSSVLGGIKIGYSTSGKNYAVQLSSGKAFVNVPWTDTVPTLSELMPTSMIGSTNKPIYWNGNQFSALEYTIDKSVPSDAVFTDTHVTSYQNHYTPQTASEAELIGSVSQTNNYLQNHEYTVLTGVTAQRDSKGHITGLTYTGQKIKDTVYGLDPDLTLNSKNITHANNITASTSTVLKKFQYDSHGHIISVSDVTSSDLLPIIRELFVGGTGISIIETNGKFSININPGTPVEITDITSAPTTIENGGTNSISFNTSVPATISLLTNGESGSWLVDATSDDEKTYHSVNIHNLSTNSTKLTIPSNTIKVIAYPIDTVRYKESQEVSLHSNSIIMKGSILATVYDPSESEIENGATDTIIVETNVPCKLTLNNASGTGWSATSSSSTTASTNHTITITNIASVTTAGTIAAGTLTAKLVPSDTSGYNTVNNVSCLTTDITLLKEKSKVTITNASINNVNIDDGLTGTITFETNTKSTISLQTSSGTGWSATTSSSNDGLEHSVIITNKTNVATAGTIAKDTIKVKATPVNTNDYTASDFVSVQDSYITLLAAKTAVTISNINQSATEIDDDQTMTITFTTSTSSKINLSSASGTGWSASSPSTTTAATNHTITIKNLPSVTTAGTIAQNTIKVTAIPTDTTNYKNSVQTSIQTQAITLNAVTETVYFSVGTTPVTVDNYTTANDVTTTIPTTMEYTNNSGSRTYAYILVPENKTVSVTEKVLGGKVTVSEYTSVSIANHKVYKTGAAVANGGTIVITLS